MSESYPRSVSIKPYDRHVRANRQGRKWANLAKIYQKRLLSVLWA